jgi:hypothetical protein
MMQMVVICVAAGLSYVVSRQFCDACKGEFTLWAMVGYFAFQLVIIAIAIVFGRVADRTLDGPASAVGRLLLFLFLWLPTILVMAPAFSEFMARNTVTALFFPTTKKPVRNNLGRMKTMIWEGDAKGAAQACLEEFALYPDEYDILLDGARLLDNRGFHREALTLLEKVIDDFVEDMTAWPLATFHAATILLEHLNRGDEARAMFRHLAKKLPDREIGIQARERMDEQWEGMYRAETDPFYHKMSSPVEKGKSRQMDDGESDTDNETRNVLAANAETPTESNDPFTNLAAEMPGMFLDEDR